MEGTVTAIYHDIAPPLTIRSGNEPGHNWVAHAHTIARWTNRRDSPNMLPKTAEDILAQLSHGRCIVIFEEDMPVGYATFYPLREEWTDRDAQWWEFGSVVVAPERRTAGYGRRIYQELPARHQMLGGTVVQTTKASPPYHCGERYAGMVELAFSELPRDIHVGVCELAPCYQAGTCRLCVFRACVDPNRTTCRLQIRHLV